MSNPGVRYERLLFWAAPITLATCAVLISTLGYNTYEDRKAANCYEQSSVVVDDDHLLSSEWASAKLESTKQKSRVPIIIFAGKVAQKLIPAVGSDCWRVINTKGDLFERDPVQIVSEFKAHASELRKNPIKMYGIEIPDVAVVGLAGTKIQIAMLSLVQALQIALAPVMLLWLGSLYHTRLREILAFKRVDDILSVHPHVINVFPVGYYPDLRKRNWLKYRAPVLWAVHTALIRISLVAVFILPSTVCFIGALFYQPVFGYWALNWFAGFWVAIYAFGVLLVEATAGLKHFNGDNALR